MKFEELKELIERNRDEELRAFIETETNVKLKGGKKNEFQGRVTKITRGEVLLFKNISKNGYETLVKERMKKEGLDPETFELKKRPWGKRIPGTPFIEHKDKIYLECIFEETPKSIVLLDGREVDKSEIPGYPEKKLKKGQGGLSPENAVRIVVYNIENIRDLKIKKEKKKKLSR